MFDSKYLEKGDRYQFGPPEHLYVAATGSRLAPSDFSLDDLERSKMKVILFDIEYVKNGKNYGVGLMGFTSDDLKRLMVKVTNGPVTAIGMWGYMPVRITGVLVVMAL